MTGKRAVLLVGSMLLLALCSAQLAAVETGALRGRITDTQGFSLPGAFISVTSPALLGAKTYLTNNSGRFFLQGLPPGDYRLLVEMPGFEAVTMDGIVISAGRTALVNIVLNPSDIEEASTRRPPSTLSGTESPGAAAVLERELIARMPLPRDFTAVLGLAPGLAFADDRPSYSAAANGAPYTANQYVQDGVNVTDPAAGGALNRVNPDILDEVVIETAAHPAEQGPVNGAYVNVITKQGGNAFAGGVVFSHTAKSYVKNLFSTEELEGTGGALPETPFRRSDLSLTLAGPVIEDFAWIFTNFRYGSRSRRGPFNYWTDPFELPHRPYGFRERGFSDIFKLSTRVIPELLAGLELNYSRVSQPVYEEDLAVNRPLESTRKLDVESFLLMKAGADYTLDPNSSLTVTAGVSNHKLPLLLNRDSWSSPQYYELASGFTWGSADYNDREKRSRFNVGASIVRYQDRVLGTLHRLVVGAEYDTSTSTSSTWKADPLLMYYSGRSAYIFGQAESPGTGELVGKGLVGFWVSPATEGAMVSRREGKHVGLFAGDTLSIADRISVSLGLRFDRSETGIRALSKGATGSEVAAALGENLVKPVLGFNLYSAASFRDWSRVVVWNVLSPRLGLNIDLFGGGWTVLKGYYATMPENMTLGYAHSLTPLSPDRAHLFYWYDDDANARVDETDTFELFQDDYRVYKSEFYTQAVDPGLKPPRMTEFSVGIEQQVFRNFSVSGRYVSRRWDNLVGNVMYDPSTGAHWYRREDSPQGWWVPFNTVVPGQGDYPDTPLTVYFRSTDSPAVFYRLENIPELKARYTGFEFSFKKRMSGNWQLYGSVLLGRARGTTDLASPWSAGSTFTILDPNSFTNITDDSVLAYDRPVNVRLMGTFRFPWDLYLSALFRAASGAPWTRTVTVIPPQDWAEEHGAAQAPVKVCLEKPGSGRYSDWNNLDLRLEKEFRKKGEVKFSVSLDAFNLLGYKYRVVDLDQGGLWLPSEEGTANGERVVSDSYLKALLLRGTRWFQLNFNLRF